MNSEIAHRPAAEPDRTEQRVRPARHFAVQLSATPRGARLARHLAAERLDSWGWSYAGDANATAALLVAELAANAVRHGRQSGRDFRLRLTLYLEDATLRIEVSDPRPDHRPPDTTTQPPAEHAESGRGLLLVAALATHWGTTCGDPYTKTVWCEVALR